MTDADQLWIEIARAFLHKFPWCGQRLDGRRYAADSDCAATGEREHADVVDHIVPLASGGARLDPMNLQSLCRRCALQKRLRHNTRPDATHG